MNTYRLIRCSKCFESFENREDSFYYNKRQKRWYLWCKTCHQKRTANRVSVKKQRTRIFSSDPVENKFIKLRHAIAVRHKRKAFIGDVITSAELLKIHNNKHGKCYYTQLDYSLDKHGPLYMTVDRVNSSLGYTKENVVLCCWFVNCAKNEWSLEQMKELWKHLPR